MRVFSRLFAAAAAALLTALLVAPAAGAAVTAAGASAPAAGEAFAGNVVIPGAVGIKPDTAPVDVGTKQIDDVAGVGADTSKARDAIDKLRSDTGVGLFAVFVDSFDGMGKDEWAQQSFTQSDLGSSDILYVVAVQDHRWTASVTSDFALTRQQVNSVLDGRAKSALSGQDWSGAVVAAAETLGDAISNGDVDNGSNSNGNGAASAPGARNSGGSSYGWVWIVLIVVIAGVAFAAYWSSRKQRAAKAKEKAGPPPEPYEQLSDRSVNALIRTDNAVRSSESELQLAEEDFGTEVTADFRAAHDDARAKLTDAFELRQQIDDDIPESEETRRGWMHEILNLCQQASDGLEAQTDRFEKLQNLKARLPEVLAALPGRIDTQRNRLPAAAATLDRLSGMYSDEALATVADNPDQANDRLEFARASLDKANETGTDDSDTGSDTDNGEAVLAARAAQEAVKQATTLLDAIDKLEGNLLAAAGQLSTAREHVSRELADATDALGDSSAGRETASLRERLAEVQATVAEVSTSAAARNPIASLKKLTDADHAVDDILEATQSAQQKEKRARRALDSELTTAQSTVSAVDDYISQRRGAMAGSARTRVAEAQRHLAQAQSLADPGARGMVTDARGAVTEARKATDLARRAYAEAQDDMGRWGGPGMGSPMRGVGGAMLGGILMGSLMGGGFRGGYGGGWGGGMGGMGGGFGGGGGIGGGFGGGIGGSF